MPNSFKYAEALNAPASSGTNNYRHRPTLADQPDSDANEPVANDSQAAFSSLIDWIAERIAEGIIKGELAKLDKQDRQDKYESNSNRCDEKHNPLEIRDS